MNFQDAEEAIEDSSSPEPKFFKLYFEFLQNKYGRLGVLLFWLIVMIVGVFYGRTLLDQTVFTFSAPSGTKGYTADEKFSKAFKTIHDEQSILIYYHCESCDTSHPINQKLSLYNMSSELNQTIFKYNHDHDGIFKSYQDYYTATYEQNHTNLSTTGFQQFAQEAYFNVCFVHPFDCVFLVIL